MADLHQYDEKKLDALKSDIVNLDVDLKQYDYQIKRCMAAIRL